MQTISPYVAGDKCCINTRTNVLVVEQTYEEVKALLVLNEQTIFGKLKTAAPASSCKLSDLEADGEVGGRPFTLGVPWTDPRIDHIEEDN